MWKKLAAKELIEGRRCLMAAQKAPQQFETQYASSWNRAMFVAEAEACFTRARRYRNKAAA